MSVIEGDDIYDVMRCRCRYNVANCDEISSCGREEESSHFSLLIWIFLQLKESNRILLSERSDNIITLNLLMKFTIAAGYVDMLL